MNYLWAGRALSGVVSSTDLKLVHDRAVAQCDRLCSAERRLCRSLAWSI
jgi:hypothetical protein